MTRTIETPEAITAAQTCTGCGTEAGSAELAGGRCAACWREEAERLREGVRMTTLTGCMKCGAGHSVGSMHELVCSACLAADNARLVAVLGEAHFSLPEGEARERAAETLRQEHPGRAVLDETERLRGERDAAVADNAFALALVREAEADSEIANEDMQAFHYRVLRDHLLRKEHPGAALLDRLTRLEEALRQYADEGAWGPLITDGGDYDYWFARKERGWEVAREALAGGGGGRAGERGRGVSELEQIDFRPELYSEWGVIPKANGVTVTLGANAEAGKSEVHFNPRAAWEFLQAFTEAFGRIGEAGEGGEVNADDGRDDGG